MIEAMLPKSGILIVVGQFPRMLRFCPDDVDIGEQACEARFPRKRLASRNAAAQSFGYAPIEREAAMGYVPDQ